MTNKFLMALLLVASLAVRTQATENTSASSVCAACHGARGEGNQQLGAPGIAGQDQAYLFRQLTNFKMGKRAYHADDAVGATMRNVALGLSDTEMASLAAEYSQMRPEPPARQESPNSDPAAGKAIYEATCAPCHGLKAQGYPQLQAPNLRGLGTWYVAGQMKNFVTGRRGDAPQYDQQSIWMRSIATHITDPKELSEVIDYIEGLSTPPRP